MKEKAVKKKPCVYCGESPINHEFAFIEGAIFFNLDTHAKFLFKYVPFFVKYFIELVPKFLFESSAIFGLARFSDDIEKALTFRSKVIWEEAKKRGIVMEQVIFLGKPLDQYRAQLKIKGKLRYYYFESIPILPEFLDKNINWDDKVVLKKELNKHNIPVPAYAELSVFFPPRLKHLENILSSLTKPVIVKPRVGSRGRHTVTNIKNMTQLCAGMNTARQICPYLIIEEHLSGQICRATVIGDKLMGFYCGSLPEVEGDGEKTIRQLINMQNKEKIEKYNIRVDDELVDHIWRLGWDLDDVLPPKLKISLSHRRGQLFGGMTREMIDELHPSFVPILEKAASVVNVSVAGFDCIIPDPKKDAASQKWGIIECNTLPFIDMHYFALEGRPRNIAGAIWDMWK